MVPSRLARTPIAASFAKPSTAEKVVDVWIAKFVDSARRRSPHNPFAVFKKGENCIARQAVRSSEVVHDIPMDAKDSFALGAHPKIAVAVDDHAVDRDFTSVERGRHEGSEGAVLELSESEAPPF